MTGSRLLTFELAPDTLRLEIHCDGEGAADAIHWLKKLAGQRKPHPDHDHWTTERVGGWELTGQPQAQASILVEFVTVRYRPRRPLAASDATGTRDEAFLDFQSAPGKDEIEVVCNEGGIKRFVACLEAAAGDAGDSSRSRPAGVPVPRSDAELLPGFMRVRDVAICFHPEAP